MAVPCCLCSAGPSSSTPLATGTAGRLQLSYNYFCRVPFWLNVPWTFSLFNLKCLLTALMRQHFWKHRVSAALNLTNE